MRTTSAAARTCSSCLGAWWPADLHSTFRYAFRVCYLLGVPVCRMMHAGGCRYDIRTADSFSSAAALREANSQQQLVGFILVILIFTPLDD